MFFENKKIIKSKELLQISIKTLDPQILFLPIQNYRSLNIQETSSNLEKYFGNYKNILLRDTCASSQPHQRFSRNLSF